MKACFTGGRPQRFPWQYDESSPQCLRLKQDIERAVEELIERGCLYFISGMAQGADTYCAEAVLRLKKKYPSVTLECALPCPTQANGWTQPQRQRYDDIIAAADKTTMVSQSYTARCMLKRNAYMVDNSDVVVAVWNGAATGGTYNTVNYAKSRGKTLKIIRY